MRRTGTGLLVLGTLITAILSGCRDDEEIRHYQVARPEPKPLNRVLGAIFPGPRESVFVKLVGPAPLMEKYTAEFERFVGTIQLSDKPDQPPSWTAPPAWRQGPTSPARLAAYYLEPRGDAVELTIISAGGTVLDNVNRWRKQLNLEPISTEEFARTAGKSTVHGVTVTLVDMSGTGSGKTGRGGPFAGGMGRGGDPHADMTPPAAEATPNAPTLKAPAEWKQLPATGMRAAAYEVTEGAQHADVVVIPLAGSGGGLLDNLNIWRSQIGLGPVGAEQMAKDVRTMEVAGITGQYVDLAAPAQGGKPAQRMLVIGVPHGGSTWFFKMTGPADLVGKQQQTFEQFVKSAQFDAAKGAR